MALLDKWIALDIGAYLARFYDFSTQKEIVLKTIIAQKGSEVLGVSDQAIAYLYKDLDTIQIQYPISHGQILHSIEPLIHEGLDKLHAFDGLLRPSVLVSVPSELSQRQRELWQQAFLNCGVRKVEFISNLEVLQEENPCFLVHSGHSYTEIHICAYDKVLVSKTIYYAGAQVDEQIQRIVYMKTGYFITKVDAAHLKEMASDAFWQQKNTLLMCYGFDSRQNLHPIQIESSIVWPAIEMVSSQISLWVKHCFDTLPASLQEYFLMHGIELSGGMADCFGPSQFISQNISCPVLCTKRGQYDMIDALKGVKSARMILLPFLISLILTPVVKQYSIYCGAYAKENKRTVHHGKISRIGGVAIYLSFIITMAIFVKADLQIKGLVIGSSIMFFTGLIDDLIDIKPLVKLTLEVIAALVLIYFGISVDIIRLPLGIQIDTGIISFVFTIIWVAGITNAVNLIDGLDGLAGGMSVIVLVVIGSIAIIERRLDLLSIAFILASGTFGFLAYNAHPASIFMGDCGSLFLGFMISAISLLGFKSSTILTLALPILLLMLPIIDTLSAILRRTLKGMKFMEADKSHIHHLLMRQFGHRNTVIIMCGLTSLFGLSAFAYMINRNIGFFVMVAILLAVEIFIEKSAMISEKFHPLIGLWHRIQRKSRKIFKKVG